MNIRQPAVAGTFYPADAQQLRACVAELLAQAPRGDARPQAIVVPHAGYPYSGPVAASAYAQLADRRNEIERVVLVGPAHRSAVRGLTVPTCDAFETPLGQVPLDRAAVDRLLAWDQVQALDAAHETEHCLEVQLPFLQTVLGEFRLVPMVVGKATPQDVGDVLQVVWPEERTLLVVSSDLSHYQPYDLAQQRDRTTAEFIERLQPEQLTPKMACGCFAIGGLLGIARQCKMTVRAVDLRNSGDTAGGRDKVVGYGAFLVE